MNVVANGGAGAAGVESCKSLLPRKGVSFASLCERVHDPGLTCGFVVEGRAQPVPSPCSWPAQVHGIAAASSSLLPRAADPKPMPTSCSSPGNAQESQCPTQGLALTPKPKHSQLRTKPNRTQPPGPCISMHKIS